jgi:hypothetical protein
MIISEIIPYKLYDLDMFLTVKKSASQWEDIFSRWAVPLSQTEEQRCQNTITAIKSALLKDDYLSQCNVFLQGSYENNTNVRQNSDIDVCVLYKDTFFGDYPSPLNRNSYGFTDSEVGYHDFRGKTYNALVDKFGWLNVEEEKKAISVESNSYRVNADVVPCFEYRKYFGAGKDEYIAGVAFKTKQTGQLIVNWPQQHIENGRKKNNETGMRYKKAVRILKKLNLEMQENGNLIFGYEAIPSFLIECMCWNVPNSYFIDTLHGSVRNCLIFMEENISKDGWFEVNGIKPLFSDQQKWSKEQALTFAEEAWKYVGYD